MQNTENVGKNIKQAKLSPLFSIGQKFSYKSADNTLKIAPRT